MHTQLRRCCCHAQTIACNPQCKVKLPNVPSSNSPLPIYDLNYPSMLFCYHCCTSQQHVWLRQVTWWLPWLAGARDTVGTTGAWHVLSNNINSVPREARIEIDIRDIDLARRDSVVKSVLDKVKAVAEERGVSYWVDMINQDPPATSADQVSLHLLHCTALLCARYIMGVRQWRLLTDSLTATLLNHTTLITAWSVLHPAAQSAGMQDLVNRNKTSIGHNCFITTLHDEFSLAHDTL